MQEKQTLTSFHVFPCAKRGYTGAFGFAKATMFDIATSFGCWIRRQIKEKLSDQYKVALDMLNENKAKACIAEE